MSYNDDDDGYRPVADRPSGRRAAKDTNRQRRPIDPDHPQLTGADGLLDLVEMSRSSVPVRKWLVDDLIPMDNVTQFAGDGGLGKSLLMMQLMCSTALGREWIGREVRQPGRVLGVFCEDDKAELHRRLYEICCAYDASMDELAENMMIVMRVAEENALMTFSRWGEEPPEETEFYKKIYASVTAHGPTLIVLDSSHDLFIGNENDRTQVRAFVGALRRLCRDNGAALVLNSHPSLTGLTSGSGTSGSTAWHNAVRSRLYLARPESEPTGPRRILAKKKMNYGSGEGEIALEWENGVFVCTDAVGTADTATKLMMTGEATGRVVDAVRDMCDRGTYPSPSDNHPSLYIVRLLMQRSELRGIDKRNMGNLVQDAVKRGLLETGIAPKSRKGKYRPCIVYKGFKVPSQALMEFQQGGAVTNETAEGNVTDPRASVTNQNGPPDLDEPPDEAYEDNARYDRARDDDHDAGEGSGDD